MREQRYSREGYLHENYHYFHLRDSAGQERDFHFHDFDKLVLLLGGQVEYLVEDQRYELRPGTVLLVKQHAIHKAVIDKTRPYERIILYLNRAFFERTLTDAHLTDCFETAGRTGNWLLAPDEAQQREIMAVLEAYERAMPDTRFGAQTMRDTLVMQLLVLIGRLNTAEAQRETGFDAKIQETLSYINEHLAEPLSVDALALARENAIRNGADVRFFSGDLFTPLRGERFDLIVSNPPYIPRGELPDLQAEVRFEPDMALDGGEDGLDFYRRIAAEASEHLNRNGWLMLEIGSTQAQDVSRLLQEHRFSEMKILPDLAGLDRVVCAYNGSRK